MKFNYIFCINFYLTVRPMYSFSQFKKPELVFVTSVKFTLDLMDQYNILNISKIPREKVLFLTCTLNQ